MTDKTNIPIPATVADCGPFKIIDGNIEEEFYCVFPDKGGLGVLSVPLGEDPDQVAIRLHEYGHLLLVSLGFHKADLPQTVVDKQIDNHWFQVCLDIIVNSFLAHRGCEEISDLPLTVPDINCHDLASIAQIFLRSAGLKSESQIKRKITKILSSEDVAFLEKTNNKLNQWSQQNTLPIKDFFSLINELQKRFGLSNDFVTNWGHIALMGDVGYYESIDDNDDNDNENNVDNASSEILRDFLKSENTIKEQRLMVKKLGLKIDFCDWNEWGNMEIVHLPLTEIHPTRKNARKFRPGFVGAFRYPHRAFIPVSDGSAFAYRQKAKGGTILLDCSSSMALSPNNISHLLDYAPMLTVAGYAGIEECCKKGSLAIFIKNGTTANKSRVREWYKKTDGGNIVDGPALRWLIKQPRPHIWISDGMVTGIRDHSSDNLRLEAKILQKLGNIKRYNNIRDCLKAFKTASP